MITTSEINASDLGGPGVRSDTGAASFDPLVASLLRWLALTEKYKVSSSCGGSTIRESLLSTVGRNSSNEFAAVYPSRSGTYFVNSHLASQWFPTFSKSFQSASLFYSMSTLTWIRVGKQWVSPSTTASLCRWPRDIRTAPAEASVEGFNFKRRDEVLQFLAEYLFLRGLLSEAVEHLRVYFPKFQFGLEVVSDPEGEDDRQLVLSVVSDISPSESLARLRQFDEEWWLDAMERARGKLCINLEFR